MQDNKINRTMAPAVRSLEKILFPVVEKETLDNGISVYFVPFGTQEVLELRLVTRGGTSFESEKGIAGITSKMMLEGSKNYSAVEFAEKLDEFGAFLHVETGYESATVSLTTLAKHIESVFPLLKEAVCEPAFPEEEFEDLKRRAIQRIEVEEQKTKFLARREFNKQLFGADHPYGKSTSKEEIEQAELQAVKAFHKKHYSPSNWTFFISGKFDKTDLMQKLNKYFGEKELYDESLKVDPNSSRALIFSESENPGFHYIEMADSMQATLRMGHISFKRDHEHFYQMTLVNTIFGGYFGSRLMKNIREEKGYTYGIGSGWLGLKYSGLFLIQTDIGNEHIESTRTEIKKELVKLIEQGVGNDELALVKNYMLGRSASARETPGQMVDIVSSTIMKGVSLSQLDEKFDILQSMTMQDVQTFAEKYYRPKDLVEVVCGKLG